MSFDGMTLDQFNTHEAAITAEVATNLGKQTEDVTLTAKSNSIPTQRRLLSAQTEATTAPDKLDVICEVEAESAEEATQLESTMLSAEFAAVLETDIQNVDSSLALVSVAVTEYAPVETTTISTSTLPVTTSASPSNITTPSSTISTTESVTTTLDATSTTISTLPVKTSASPSGITTASTTTTKESVTTTLDATSTTISTQDSTMSSTESSANTTLPATSTTISTPTTTISSTTGIVETSAAPSGITTPSTDTSTTESVTTIPTTISIPESTMSSTESSANTTLPATSTTIFTPTTTISSTTGIVETSTAPSGITTPSTTTSTTESVTTTLDATSTTISTLPVTTSASPSGITTPSTATTKESVTTTLDATSTTISTQVTEVEMTEVTALPANYRPESVIYDKFTGNWWASTFVPNPMMSQVYEILPDNNYTQVPKLVSTSGYALYGLAVSETQLFAVAADTGAVKIWNKATRAESTVSIPTTLKGDGSSYLNDIAYFNDAVYVTDTQAEGPTGIIWKVDLSTSEVTKILELENFSPNGIAVDSHMNTLMINDRLRDQWAAYDFNDGSHQTIDVSELDCEEWDGFEVISSGSYYVSCVTAGKKAIYKVKVTSDGQLGDGVEKTNVAVGSTCYNLGYDSSRGLLMCPDISTAQINVLQIPADSENSTISSTESSATTLPVTTTAATSTTILTPTLPVTTSASPSGITTPSTTTSTTESVTTTLDATSTTISTQDSTMSSTQSSDNTMSSTGASVSTMSSTESSETSVESTKAPLSDCTQSDTAQLASACKCGSTESCGRGYYCYVFSLCEDRPKDEPQDLLSFFQFEGNYNAIIPDAQAKVTLLQECTSYLQTILYLPACSCTNAVAGSIIIHMTGPETQLGEAYNQLKQTPMDLNSFPPLKIIDVTTEESQVIDASEDDDSSNNIIVIIVVVMVLLCCCGGCGFAYTQGICDGDGTDDGCDDVEGGLEMETTHKRAPEVNATGGAAFTDEGATTCEL